MNTDNTTESRRQARAQVNSVVELVTALVVAHGNDTEEDHAREAIYADALSVEVRAAGWSSLREPLKADEFRIVLCTGGPHVELRGELDDFSEPVAGSVKVLYQDWFTQLKELDDITAAEQDALQAYCGCFYFDQD